MVEKLQSEGEYDFALVADYLNGVIWRASFNGDDMVSNDGTGMPNVFTHGLDDLTAPHAICLAALKAVGVEI